MDTGVGDKAAVQVVRTGSHAESQLDLPKEIIVRFLNFFYYPNFWITPRVMVLDGGINIGARAINSPGQYIS